MEQNKVGEDMAKKCIGILMLLAGFVIPLHKEVLLQSDYIAMAIFIVGGALCLLLPGRKKTEDNAIYQATWEIPHVSLFSAENNQPLLTLGEQLLVCPYTGHNHDQVTIVTAAEHIVGNVPQEFLAYILRKIEAHSPIRLTVKEIKMEEGGKTYHVVVDMMC